LSILGIKNQDESHWDFSMNVVSSSCLRILRGILVGILGGTLVLIVSNFFAFKDPKSSPNQRLNRPLKLCISPLFLWSPRQDFAREHYKDEAALSQLYEVKAM